MIVKVCGMRLAENIKPLIPLSVDWVGFIFYSKSKRHIEAEGIDVEFLKRSGGVTQGLDRVGVFVDSSFEEIIEKARKYRLTRIQLHGDEPSSLCLALQKEGYSVIKAFSVDADFNFRSTVSFEVVCDYFLFDTKGKEKGGNGVMFDWGLLERYEGNTDFILSGGIGPGSVEAILGLDHERFAGIDLNSGFEEEAGVKDVGKLGKFLDELMGRIDGGVGFWGGG